MIRIYVVILQRKNSLYVMAKYTPYATISDIEVMMNVSYRTATRLMARMKQDLGIEKWKRPTMDQVKAYFGST